LDGGLLALCWLEDISTTGNIVGVRIARIAKIWRVVFKVEGHKKVIVYKVEDSTIRQLLNILDLFKRARYINSSGIVLNHQNRESVGEDHVLNMKFTVINCDSVLEGHWKTEDLGSNVLPFFVYIVESEYSILFMRHLDSLIIREIKRGVMNIDQESNITVVVIGQGAVKPG
jgi:hypothetical protein